MLAITGEQALVTFVMKTIKIHVLRCIPTKSRIFSLVAQTFKRVTRFQCQELVNTFEIPPFEWDSLNMVLNVGTCSPTEQQCCQGSIKLCRDALTVAYLMMTSNKSGQEALPQIPA